MALQRIEAIYSRQKADSESVQRLVLRAGAPGKRLGDRRICG